MTTPPRSEPVDLAIVDNAMRRAESLAAADPTNPLADEVAAELAEHLVGLIPQAEYRLTRMPSRTPGQQRAHDVLEDAICHARSVRHDEETGRFSNPSARLYLLAGACRLMKTGMAPTW